MECFFIPETNMHIRIKLLVTLLTVVLTISTFLTSCSMQRNKANTKTDFFFDTAVTITLYGNDKKYISDCFDLCKKYENMFSNTVSNSEICKINDAARSNSAVNVSKETIELLNKGIYYGDISNGKFDITIGKLSELWDFNGDNPTVPDTNTISSMLKDINYKNIEIKDQSVLLKDANSKIDLGGIAKGFIADKLKTYLESKGVQSGIINLGGNILLIGSKPDHSEFNIGIQKPFANDDSSIAVLSIKDKSIVTSGVYERYFYDTDTLYHHILDTKTGYPVKNNLLGVTIISDLSVDGDGLSTTTFTMGLTDGMKFIEDLENVEAVFVDDQYQLHLTSGLKIKDDTITFVK